MIDKYLRRFCAQEVQILIAKMEEDYSEFTKYHSAWGRLLEAQTYLTKVEKFCVRKAKHRAASDHDRQQYLAAILKQQLAPMTREEMEDSAPMSKATQMNLQQQYMKAQMRNQMMNAASQPTSYQQGSYK